MPELNAYNTARFIRGQNMLDLVIGILISAAIYELFIDPMIRDREMRERRERPKRLAEEKSAAEMARRAAARKAAMLRPLYDRIEGWGKLTRRCYPRIVKWIVGRSTAMDRVLAKYQQEFPDPAPSKPWWKD
jgi:hypothetical protein